MNVPRQTVIYSTDENFWPHTYVSLHSLLVNNQDVSFDVRILAEAPNEQFFAHIARLQRLHGDVEISWLPVEDHLFADVPILVSYFTKATYYRLLIGRLLPGTVRRVLYLDGDTIVRGSLRDLFTLDIDDWVLAATPEYDPLFPPTRLGLPEGTPYFNAGVLVFNLDNWRDLQIEKRCLEFIQANISNPSRLKFADQDVLNAVLVGKWRSIGPAFNFNKWTADPQRLNDFDPGTQIGEQIPASGPAIVHYVGWIKPWHGGHSYDSDYWYYRMQTPYADRLKLVRCKLVGVVRVVRMVRRRLVGVVRKLPRGNSILRVVQTVMRRQPMGSE